VRSEWCVEEKRGEQNERVRVEPHLAVTLGFLDQLHPEYASSNLLQDRERSIQVWLEEEHGQ
jgi:hypothetical protein